MDAVFAEFLRLRHPQLASEFLAFKANHTASPLEDSAALAAPASPVPACKASASSTAASVVPAVPASPILASKTAASSAVVTVPAARSSAASVAPSKTPARRSPAPASSSSDSDSKMEVDLAPASSTDGFTLVQKGKKRAAESRAPAAAKISKAANASRPRPQTPVAPPARATPSPRPVAQNKTQTPPPVILQEKAAWDRVCLALKAKNINFTNARNLANGIQIKVQTPDDHRALSSYLRKERISFHTYTLQEERELRVVIRGIPKELDVELLKADLLEQGLPVNSVHRMHTGRGREPYNMVLVALQPTPEGKKIFNTQTVCRLSGIAVEAPHKKGTPSQCHNCQLYGHSSRNCHARPRCVKCLGDHATALCARDQKTATEPPSCVLCRTQGHPANYRGCPRAPKINRRVARQNRLRASGPDIKASAPS
ncbi:hypothetical protein FEG31_19275, partial [Acinetobacter baumannii]